VARELHCRTQHLELVPRTREELRAAIEAMDAYTKAHLSADWLALFASSAERDPWVHGFSVVRTESGAVVGTGGFKGPPAEGVVEIAYGVAAEHQNKGYATEVAAALVGYAFAFAEVKLVRAHTLPDSVASKRVLAKCGFDHVGDVVDPEDGVVARFEKRRGGAGITRPSKVDELLARYPEPVREIASAARSFLKNALPDIAESVDESAKLLGYRYGPGYKGLVCTLILSQKEVKLGIFRSTELPDPKRLMMGAGKVHRHVPLRSAADLEQPGLKVLLAAALAAWKARNA
jgi:[ribosomal protein S5]-alanine N-acetyltransferase